MEFKKAMAIMRMMCNNVEVYCEKCPLFINDNCSTRPWVDSDVEQVEGILDKWDKTHQEPQYQTWWEWLADKGIVPEEVKPIVAYELSKTGLVNPIPADIAEKLGLKPKEAANNAGH